MTPAASPCRQEVQTGHYHCHPIVSAPPNALSGRVILPDVESDLPRCHSGSGRLNAAGSFPGKEESESCRSGPAVRQTQATDQGETIAVTLFGAKQFLLTYSFARVPCYVWSVAKQLTSDQVQSRKDQAVRFLEHVKDDPDRAAEVEDESLEDYAERRGF